MPAVQRIFAPGALTYTPININASGDIILATGSTKFLHVVKILLVPASSVTITPTFGSTPCTGAMTLAAALSLQGMEVGADAPGSLYPLWSGGAGEKFLLTLGSGVQVSGGVWTCETSP